jgi:hypothetical protein
MREVIRCLRLAAALGILFMASGCASIVEGTDQTVTVQTDPSGATCELKRDGANIAVVNPTPGSIVIGKSKDDVSVICDKDGYQRTASSLRSEFQGMTFGNILFGGLIGVAVDAGSGAMNEYPSQVTLILPPEEFPSATARKKYFDRREREIQEQTQEAIARVRSECGDPDEKPKCATAIEKIRENRDKKLGELEAKRAEATIAAAN